MHKTDFLSYNYTILIFTKKIAQILKEDKNKLADFEKYAKLIFFKIRLCRDMKKY